MNTKALIAKIYLHHRLVGVLAEVAGIRSFEYDPAYLNAGGFSISPVYLPGESGVFQFSQLNRVDAFKGLPGVLADSLPDKFGERLQRIFFEKHGVRPQDLSPVQQLLYVGSRGMGALVFEPAEERATPYQLPLELAQLRVQAKAAIEGHTNDVLTEIMEAGSSAGGMRAKALIGWNREANTMVANMPELPVGYEPWLIKLDGVDNHGVPGEFGRLEYAYSRMASAAGINMSQCELIEDGDAHHFATRRFDRIGTDRVHYHSLAGLQHIDFNVPQSCSYDLYFASVRLLNLGAHELAEAYRRMVFACVARSQDDHPKNFGFLMEADGQWRLAPAFDVTYAHGKGYTANHQMLINGKCDEITRADLLVVAQKQGIRNASGIIDQVMHAVSRWPSFAQEAGLSQSWTKAIYDDFRIKECGDVPRPAPVRRGMR